MSQNFVAHSAACSGWASNSSIFRARLSGRVSARKARTSSRRRQRADGVDGDAAQEFGVAGQVGRHDVEALELGEDLAVDVVDLGHVRVAEAGRGFHRHQDAHRQHVAAIGDDDGRVAGPQRLELAQRVDLGDGVVVGAEVAERRDVLLRAVGEGGLDPELAGLAGLGEGIFRRVDGDGSDVAAALVPGGALRDPLAEQLILPGIFGRSALAAVRRPGRSP